MKHLLLLITTVLMLLFAQNAYSQTDTAYKKIPFLFAAVNYSQTVTNKTMPSNGLHISLGLNIARLLKQKFSFGVMFDYRVFKILGSNWQYNQLTNAINASIIRNQSNPVDSTRASLLYKAFNNDSGAQFFGCYLSNYGVFFSPFPNKYGAIMLQIKRGNYAFPIDGVYWNKYIGDGKQEWILLTVPTPLNVQLTCKPFTFFKSTKEDSWKNYVLFSIFYETVSLKAATFDGQLLSKYLKPAFFDSHGTGHHLGFKLSCGIY